MIACVLCIKYSESAARLGKSALYLSDCTNITAFIFQIKLHNTPNKPILHNAAVLKLFADQITKSCNWMKKVLSANKNVQQACLIRMRLITIYCAISSI